MVDLSLWSLADLMDLTPNGAESIQEAYEIECFHNGEDRDFCDTRAFEYMCDDIRSEIEYRLDFARWD